MAPAELRVLVRTWRMISNIAHALLPGQVSDDFSIVVMPILRAGSLIMRRRRTSSRVYDDSQIAVDVLDLLAVKEALAAHNAVRDARAGKVGLERGRLGVHPVEHGVVLQMARPPAGARR